MAYIERKEINGNFYLYLYESYRVPGARYPKRRMIRYLGPESDFEGVSFEGLDFASITKIRKENKR